LTNEPGTKFQYSNLGMSLLGHALELKAGTNFESLVVERICRPLRMDSTCITLAPELRARSAAGHDKSGKRAADYRLRVMAPAGALHSTANDMLKYLSANLGFTKSALTPLMEKMQIIRHEGSPEFGKSAMPWVDQGVHNPPGTELLGHAGGTAGSSTFIGFDKRKRRGVVVLSNQSVIHASTVGWRILQRATLTVTNAAMMSPFKEYVGSGIAYELNQRDQTLRILKVYPNTSASRAGLSAGLIVQKVNGVPTAGKSLTECIDLGRGGVGTMVRMELVDPTRQETNTVELTKRKFAAD
jgi:CubicO group peptidase (beta-lactamase class C family)